jgi:hypothetical protein
VAPCRVHVGSPIVALEILLKLVLDARCPHKIRIGLASRRRYIAVTAHQEVPSDMSVYAKKA